MDTNQQELFKRASNDSLGSIVAFVKKGEYCEWKKICENLPIDLAADINSKNLSRKKAKTQQKHLEEIEEFPPFIIDVIYHIFVNYKVLKTNKMTDRINKTLRMYREYLINQQIKTLPMDQINYNVITKCLDNMSQSMNMMVPSVYVQCMTHVYHQSDTYFILDLDDTLFPTTCLQEIQSENLLEWLKSCNINKKYHEILSENGCESIEDVKRKIDNDDNLKDIGILKASVQKKLLSKIPEIELDENGYVDPNQFTFKYKQLNTEKIIHTLSKFFNQIRNDYYSPNICVVTNGCWNWIEHIMTKYPEYDILFKKFGINCYSARSMYGEAYNSCNRQWKVECFKFVTKRHQIGLIEGNNINVYSIGDGTDEFVASNEFAKQMGNVNLCRIKLIDFPTEQEISNQFKELIQLFSQKRSLKNYIFNLEHVMPSKYNNIDLYDDKNWSSSFPATLKKNYDLKINETKLKLQNGIKIKYKNKIYEILNGSNWPKLELSENTVIDNMMDNKYRESFQILVVDENIANWMNDMSLCCNLCAEYVEVTHRNKETEWIQQTFSSLQKLDGHYINKHNEIPYVVDNINDKNTSTNNNKK